jgi:hypothetical protein
MRGSWHPIHADPTWVDLSALAIGSLPNGIAAFEVIAVLQGSAQRARGDRRLWDHRHFRKCNRRDAARIVEFLWMYTRDRLNPTSFGQAGDSG